MLTPKFKLKDIIAPPLNTYEEARAKGFDTFQIYDISIKSSLGFPDWRIIYSMRNVNGFTVSKNEKDLLIPEMEDFL